MPLCAELLGRRAFLAAGARYSFRRAWAGPASVGAELHFRGGARLGATAPPVAIAPGATVEEVGLFGRARDVEARGVADEEEE